MPDPPDESEGAERSERGGQRAGLRQVDEVRAHVGDGVVDEILFDVDDFKQINDEHGHLCGDFVLQQIARIGRREMRREELLGRLGGDEFGILSPEVEADGAVVLAERLRTAIAARRFSAEFITQPLEVTCSFGVAQLTPEMSNPEAFFSAADSALY